MKVCILYGAFEGHGHGKKLRAELKAHSYLLTKEPEEADAIIAHSGGGFMLPQQAKTKVIILVGLPHWPGKSVTSRMFNKILKDPKDMIWLRKSLLNIFYAFLQPIKLYNMHQGMKKHILPNNDNSIVAVLNSKDKFIHEISFTSLVNEYGWQLHEFDGHHDDLWLNPKPYVELLDTYLHTK